MRRGPHVPARSNLRLGELMARRPHASRLMNVKLPADLVDSIDALAERLDASKTETVVMLLNEALRRHRPRRS